MVAPCFTVPTPTACGMYRAFCFVILFMTAIDVLLRDNAIDAHGSVNLCRFLAADISWAVQ
jgi:hypothetical protein